MLNLIEIFARIETNALIQKYKKVANAWFRSLFLKNEYFSI